MKLKSHTAIKNTWGSNALWLDLSRFSLKGMVIIRSTNNSTLSRYDEIHLADFAGGGAYTEIFKACTHLLNQGERLVLSMEYQALFLNVVIQNNSTFTVVKKARVGLFFGREPADIAQRAALSLENSLSTSSKNPRVRRFLDMFQKKEIIGNPQLCFTIFEHATAMPLRRQERNTIAHAIKVAKEVFE